MNVNMDLIGNGQAQGELAAYMMTSGRMTANAMRPWIGDDGKAYISMYSGKGDPKDIKSYSSIPVANATLRRDEWKQLDDALLPAARTRLVGIQDLIDNNLIYSLGNAMGTTVLEWHDVSDSMNADLTMDGVTRSAGDRPNYTHNYLPIPIVHVDYEINMRALEASRKLGNPLDTTSAEHAARKVAEKLETMLFTDTTYAFGGGTIYSYLNHPNRNQVTLSTYGNWDASGTTPQEIKDSVLAMKQASINDRHYGPWMLYIPTAYETVLDDDFDDTRGNTVRQRLLAIDGIKGIKVIDTLTANNVLLVEMSTATVRLVRGLGIQNVEWKTEGNLITKYKIMTIQVPQIRADQNGMSGLVHMA